MSNDPSKTDDHYREALTPEQYRVARLKGTERPFTGQYWNEWSAGEYNCICCDAPLFQSDTKFDAGCGWPSFFSPAVAENVGEVTDLTHGMRRVEVICNNCGAHLGHVFNDGPEPTGLRYCINSASLKFAPEG